MAPRTHLPPFGTRHLPSGEVVVLATGRITYADAPRLRRQLQALIHSGSIRVVIDLTEVETIDSSGVGAIVAGFKDAKAQTGYLRVTGVSPAVRSVLEMLNLDKLLMSEESVETPISKRA